MRKILLVVLLCFILVGCHGSKNESNSFVIPESFDETKIYELTFWAKNDTNITQVNIYKNAISEFERLYPNIKINLRLYTDYGRIYNDVITNIATDTTPNICITYPDHIATYITGNNTVVDLDSLMIDSKYGLGGSSIKFDSPSKDEITSKFLDECFFSNHYYALPFMRSTEATYINADMVKALGYDIPDVLTWDYIWELSEMAMAKDSDGNFIINNQKVMIPFIYKSTDNMMISMAYQLDSGYSDDSGQIYLFNDQTKDLLLKVNRHAKSGAFSTFKISSYPGNYLNAGQCIFAIDSTAGATWMGADATHHDISEDSIIQFETVVRPIPQYDVSSPKMISQGPSLCIFNKQDPQEVLASWIFMQYLLTNDVQIAYSQTEGYTPVTDKARNSNEYIDYLSKKGLDTDLYYKTKIEATQLLLDNTDNTFVTPVFNGSVSLRDASGQLIEEVCKAARRNVNVDDSYIDKLYDDVSSLYRLDQTSGSISKDLGPLPATSKVLLISLVTIWLIIGFIYLKQFKK